MADNRPGASPENVWWSGNQIEVNVFIYGYESAWLPASLLEQQDRLAEALFASTRHFEVQLHFNFFDKAWQTSFWGPNYPRLRAVKAKYDPTGLFFVHHGVGSEEWSADGFTRSR